MSDGFLKQLDNFLENWEPQEGSGELCGLKETPEAALYVYSPQEKHPLQRVQS